MSIVTRNLHQNRKLKLFITKKHIKNGPSPLRQNVRQGANIYTNAMQSNFKPGNNLNITKNIDPDAISSLRSPNTSPTPTTSPIQINNRELSPVCVHPITQQNGVA